MLRDTLSPCPYCKMVLPDHPEIQTDDRGRYIECPHSQKRVRLVQTGAGYGSPATLDTEKDCLDGWFDLLDD